MLVARLVMKVDDSSEDYFSEYDRQAMQLFRECHSQDTGEVDLSEIACAEFRSMNPSYKLED